MAEQDPNHKKLKKRMPGNKDFLKAVEQNGHILQQDRFLCAIFYGSDCPAVAFYLWGFSLICTDVQITRFLNNLKNKLHRLLAVERSNYYNCYVDFLPSKLFSRNYKSQTSQISF